MCVCVFVFVPPHPGASVIVLRYTVRGRLRQMTYHHSYRRFTLSNDFLIRVDIYKYAVTRGLLYFKSTYIFCVRRFSCCLFFMLFCFSRLTRTEKLSVQLPFTTLTETVLSPSLPHFFPIHPVTMIVPRYTVTSGLLYFKPTFFISYVFSN